MAIKKHGIIIETPMEVRQAEPGPSVLLGHWLRARCIGPGRYLVFVFSDLTERLPCAEWSR
jgi:hypothetical protein